MGPHTRGETRAIFAKTPVNGRCSGREGDELIISIKALQHFADGVLVDGRVSSVKKDTTYIHQGSPQRFLIFYLNAVLRVLHPQQYPRIDLMPEFVWRIKDKATYPFTT